MASWKKSGYPGPTETHKECFSKFVPAWGNAVYSQKGQFNLITTYFVDLLLYSCYLLHGRGFNQNQPLVHSTSSKLQM